MNRLETFQEFLAGQGTPISVGWVLVNLILSGALALILGWVYVRYGRSLSNRRIFARNFLLTTMTTMLIITIVKSSLALSLGLVGALSIVRFRAAIKEPEELSYLFLAIGIGLGLGANQAVITVTAFAVIVGIMVLRSWWRGSDEKHNLYLTISSHNPEKASLGEVVETLKRHCKAVDMKRFDETKEVLEASFLVEFDNFDQLREGKSELQRLNENIKVSFLDSKGIAT